LDLGDRDAVLSAFRSIRHVPLESRNPFVHARKMRARTSNCQYIEVARFGTDPCPSTHRFAARSGRGEPGIALQTPFTEIGSAPQAPLTLSAPRSGVSKGPGFTPRRNAARGGRSGPRNG